MKTVRGRRLSLSAQSRELADLRVRVTEAEETLRAIRAGEVDAVVVAGRQGDQVFTLEGAEHAYRVLIESINEGALTLTADKTILFANQCFARLVKCPLERVIGGSLRRFLSEEDQAAVRAVLRRAGRSRSKIQVMLKAADGSETPAQISVSRLARNRINRAAVGMVVTDMTEARRIEGLLRALANRVVQGQESERGRVALELHDNITQLLCAVLLRSQALANKLSARDGPSKGEAMKLRDMLGQVAGEVERISANLRPGVLDHLGLIAVLTDSSEKFADRTGVPVKVDFEELPTRLPPSTELTLYRIFQEALGNVEKHARARHVTVCLGRRGAFVLLAVHDDGAGFDPAHHTSRREGKAGLGLLGMRERASHAGGALTVRSARLRGTEIEVRIPLANLAAAN